MLSRRRPNPNKKTYIAHDPVTGKVVIKEDRRRYDRVLDRRLTTFKIPGREEFFSAETVDVSHGGTKLRIAKSFSFLEFKEDDYILVRMAESQQVSTPICAVARIRYVQIRENNILLGLQFMAEVTGVKDYDLDWENIEKLYSKYKENQVEYERMIIEEHVHPWEVMSRTGDF